jgi:hypothetical protein
MRAGVAGSASSGLADASASLDTAADVDAVVVLDDACADIDSADAGRTLLLLVGVGRGLGVDGGDLRSGVASKHTKTPFCKAAFIHCLYQRLLTIFCQL